MFKLWTQISQFVKISIVQIYFHIPLRRRYFFFTFIYQNMFLDPFSNICSSLSCRQQTVESRQQTIDSRQQIVLMVIASFCMQVKNAGFARNKKNLASKAALYDMLNKFQSRSWFNSLPLFLLQGCQFKDLFMSQCLCI